MQKTDQTTRSRDESKQRSQISKHQSAIRSRSLWFDQFLSLSPFLFLRLVFFLVADRLFSQCVEKADKAKRKINKFWIEQACVQYQLQVGTGSSSIVFKRSFFRLLCDAAAAADRIDHCLD